MPAIAVVVILAAAVAAGVGLVGLDQVVSSVTGRSFDPGRTVVNAIDPAPGSMAWKLKHGQPVSILMLGYGGDENDAPYLTDSIMAITIEPTTHRVMLASIPRDLWVKLDLFSGQQALYDKVNAAYATGIDDGSFPGKQSQFTGRDGGGHASEHVVENVTGIKFDKYVAVDFRFFRDVVDALGGVDVCLATDLDDYSYPNYSHGYTPIHFKAGCRRYDGEQTLELARSRDAVQYEQATDFARSKRQQDILLAIKRRAESGSAVPRIVQLLTALAKDVRTDMDLNDMQTLYDWGIRLPDSSTIHVALTTQDWLHEGQNGQCDQPFGEYAACANDGTFGMLHQYFAAVFVPPAVLRESAPIQFANGSAYPALAQQVTPVIDPLGFQVTDPANHAYSAQTVILDYSNGQFPLTSRWLADYFGASVQVATAKSDPPAYLQQTDGLVVVLGHDFGQRWYGLR